MLFGGKKTVDREEIEVLRAKYNVAQGGRRWKESPNQKEGFVFF